MEEALSCIGPVSYTHLSKSYAMTGWRLGYAAAPSLILKQMLKIHQYAIMCAPTTSQYAAVSALKNGDSDVEMTVSYTHLDAVIPVSSVRVRVFRRYQSRFVVMAQQADA